MTVSSFDAMSSAARAARRVVATFALSLLGCRPGLPPEPAGQDAADANAPTPKYQARPNVYETSAFDGVNVDAASGHEGMNHGGMNHGTKPAAAPKDPPTPPTGKHEGMDMPEVRK